MARSRQPQSQTEEEKKSKELTLEEKAAILEEKAERLNGSVCLMMSQLSQPKRLGRIVPLIEFGFDAPGSTLKKAITQLKAKAEILGQGSLVDEFEEQMRALQNSWVSGKRVDIDEAKGLARRLSTRIKDALKSQEHKEEEAVEVLKQQMAAFPAKIDKEIERLEQETRQHVRDNESTEAYQKLVQAAGDDWKKKLPCFFDDPGELSKREQEETQERDKAQQNAIQRLVKRNNQAANFNHMDGLQFSIAREKDEKGNMLFKVTYADDKPTNIEQAMDIMIARCHELNPASLIYLSCTPLSTIRYDTVRYSQMRFEELQYAVAAAEKLNVGIQLDETMLDLLNQLPSPKDKELAQHFLSKIHELHGQWTRNVKDSRAIERGNAISQYSYKEDKFSNMLEEPNRLKDYSLDKLKQAAKALGNNYQHLDRISQSIKESLASLEKRVDECKKNKNELENCLAELNNFKIIQKDTDEKLIKLLEYGFVFFQNVSDENMKELLKDSEATKALARRKEDDVSQSENNTNIQKLISQFETDHKNLLLEIKTRQSQRF